MIACNPAFRQAFTTLHWHGADLWRPNNSSFFECSPPIIPECSPQIYSANSSFLNFVLRLNRSEPEVMQCTRHVLHAVVFYPSDKQVSTSSVEGHPCTFFCRIIIDVRNRIDFNSLDSWHVALKTTHRFWPQLENNPTNNLCIKWQSPGMLYSHHIGVA